MTNDIVQLSVTARRAMQSKDWLVVQRCAKTLLKRDPNSAEGHFLQGMAGKAAGQQARSAREFRAALDADHNRYDAAMELAYQYLVVGHNSDAVSLLDKYTRLLGNSPYYLELAATTYTRLGLHEKACMQLQRACELQPEIERFRAGLAACYVLLGKIKDAREIYLSLLERNPGHQQNHYELSKLGTAKNAEHIDAMKVVLDEGDKSPQNSIFMYYAIGKELEDLGRWDESFDYLQRAGAAAASVADYDVATDTTLIDTVVDVCSDEWLADSVSQSHAAGDEKTPIFIVGLPRTGTTLVERIISSHSEVESADETQYVEMALKKNSKLSSTSHMTTAIVVAAAREKPEGLARAYMDFVRHRLGDKPYFVDKYPENFLYAGFIAKAFPQARILQVTRHPMDACFAMFKQSYFRYAFTLDELARYYVAYWRLREHWEAVLSDRLISISYEALVADQEGETRGMLDSLGLSFEESCLNFHQHAAPSATASAVQVREKVHSRSVGHWTHFRQQLQPLQDHLEQAGISTN